MFSKLKEKLKNWTKKVAETEEEKVVKAKPENKDKTIKPSVKEDKTLIKKMIFEPSESEAKQIEPKKGLISKVKSKISKIKIREKEFNVYAEELETLLLENNVALEVTEKIIQKLKQDIVGKELLKDEIEDEITEAFKNIIREILIKPFDVTEKIKQKNSESHEPYVILFVGINGSGKTTTIAKIADNLQKQGISCVLAAADTFRAASIEQLKEHGEKIGVKVISHEYGSDAAAVGFDAIKYAKKHAIKAVLIDTRYQSSPNRHSRKNAYCKRFNERN